MKILFLIICLVTISCNEQSKKTEKTFQRESIFQPESFDTTKVYSEPCCLQYKGRPLLTIGQNVNQLDPSLSFRYDPNGSFEKYSTSVTDYLSLDDYFSVKDASESIDGIVFFSVDKKGRIFALSSNWTLNGGLVDTSGKETIRLLKKFFPCFPPDLKGKGSVELIRKGFIEKFTVYSAMDFSNPALVYSVKLTNNIGR